MSAMSCPRPKQSVSDVLSWTWHQPSAAGLPTWPAGRVSKPGALGVEHVGLDGRLAQLEPRQAGLGVFLVGLRSRPFLLARFLVEPCAGPSETHAGQPGLRTAPREPRAMLEEARTRLGETRSWLEENASSPGKMRS